MDCKFMESCWWAFNKLYNKNLVYRKYKVAFYSYPLQSPLSNFEVQQNYKTKKTKSVYVRFLVKNQMINNLPVYLVAWTTTPWTLIANCALCVNKDLDYNYYLTATAVYIMSANHCLDKLTEVSGFIEKKTNDTSLSTQVLEQLGKLQTIHELLFVEICNFNGISQDVSLLVKETIITNSNQDLINYISFDITNKYKQIIFKIFHLVKKANVYAELLKAKIPI